MNWSNINKLKPLLVGLAVTAAGLAYTSATGEAVPVPGLEALDWGQLFGAAILAIVGVFTAPANVP